MRDAVFFRQAAGIDDPLGQFAFVVGGAQPEIDALAGGRLDLGEDVPAIQRNNRFARARLHVFAERFAELQQLIVNGAQRRFRRNIALRRTARRPRGKPLDRCLRRPCLRRARPATTPSLCRACASTGATRGATSRLRDLPFGSAPSTRRASGRFSPLARRPISAPWRRQGEPRRETRFWGALLRALRDSSFVFASRAKQVQITLRLEPRFASGQDSSRTRRRQIPLVQTR